MGALIVGAGLGLSAALAERFRRSGLQVGLSAREIGKLDGLASELGCVTQACDAADPEQVDALFAWADATLPPLEIVVFNASRRYRGPLLELDRAAVREAIEVGGFAGFMVAQEAARRMIPRAKGTIMLTGATASVKGNAQSTPFAMAKFALRGLAQCLARELHPQGIHVIHAVIDGVIRRADDEDGHDDQMDPAAIAESLWGLHRQPRSAWSWETELRPWVERF